MKQPPSRSCRPHQPKNYCPQEIESLHRWVARIEALHWPQGRAPVTTSVACEDDPTTIHLCVLAAPSADYGFGADLGHPLHMTACSAYAEKTLNRAGILALSKLMPLTGTRPVTVFTNVHYLAETLAHQRPRRWAREGWKHPTGGFRANCDQWSEPDLLEATARVVAAYHVPDHSSAEMSRAYDLAMRAMREVEAFQ